MELDRCQAQIRRMEEQSKLPNFPIRDKAGLHVLQIYEKHCQRSIELYSLPETEENRPRRKELNLEIMRWHDEERSTYEAYCPTEDQAEESSEKNGDSSDDSAMSLGRFALWLLDNKLLANEIKYRNQALGLVEKFCAENGIVRKAETIRSNLATAKARQK
jgi:hypothetical protein